MAMYTDPTTKLRIKNPLIESSLLAMHLKSRNVKPLAKLSFKDASNESPIEIDTCGVLIYKSVQKRTVSGDPFVVFRISDLETMQTSLTIMLFRDAVNDHIDIPIGSVVLLISAICKGNQNSNNKDQNSVSVNEGWQIVRLGTANDYGICRGQRKNGQSCTIPVNTQKGGHCQFHIQKSVSKQSVAPGRQALLNAKKYATISTGSGYGRDGHHPVPAVQNKMPPGMMGVYRKGSLGATISTNMVSTSRFGGSTLASLGQANHHNTGNRGVSSNGMSTPNLSSYYVPTSSKKPQSLARALSSRSTSSTHQTIRPSSSSSSSGIYSSSRPTSRPTIDPSPGAKRPSASNNGDHNIITHNSLNNGAINHNSASSSQNLITSSEPTDDEWEQLLEKTEKQYELKEKQEIDPLGCLLSDKEEEISSNKRKLTDSNRNSSKNSIGRSLEEGRQRKILKVDDGHGVLIKTNKRSEGFYGVSNDSNKLNLSSTRSDGSSIIRNGNVIVPEESQIFKIAESKYIQHRENQMKNGRVNHPLSNSNRSSLSSTSSIYNQIKNKHPLSSSLSAQVVSKQMILNSNNEEDEISLNDINGNHLPRLGVSHKEILKNQQQMKLAQTEAARLMLKAKQQATSQPSRSLNDILKEKQKKTQVESLNKSVLGGCKLASVMNPTLLNPLDKKLTQSNQAQHHTSQLGGLSQSFTSNQVNKHRNQSSHQVNTQVNTQGLSAELLSLINVKSKHANLVMEEDGLKCDEYLDYLEVKDTAQTELEKITEQKCNAYHCDQCNYISDHLRTDCRLSNHSFRTLPAIRKFYECSNCKKRTQKVTAKGRTSHLPRPCLCDGTGMWKPCGASNVRSNKESSLSRSNGLLLSMSESTSYQDRISSARDAVTQGDF